ncbi:hypothetical protein EDD17DRAFT_1092368 [Pisolithus thermaeus]|nr:hypothetical protein EDD17DRAFT_1092368 [Pisolithus thermaeus]
MQSQVACRRRCSFSFSYRMLLNSRCVSTSSTGQYPFPTRRNPTPEEIFHLPPNASHGQIKARYYELVKLYHPDSVHVQTLPHAERTSRFQAFQRAYEVLQRPRMEGIGTYDDLLQAEIIRRRRPQPHWRSPGGSMGMGTGTGSMHFDHIHTQSSDASRTPATDEMGAILKGICIAALYIAILMAPAMSPGRTQNRTAAANLAQAQQDAQEFGMERRRQIRELVREYEAERGEPIKKRMITRRQREHPHGDHSDSEGPSEETA